MWTTLFNHLRQTTELVLASMTSLRLYQCVRISMTSMTAQLLKVQEMLPGPQKTYAGHRPRGERPPAHKTLVLTCVLLSLAIGSLHSPLQPLQLSHMSQPLGGSLLFQGLHLVSGIIPLLRHLLPLYLQCDVLAYQLSYPEHCLSEANTGCCIEQDR